MSVLVNDPCDDFVTAPWTTTGSPTVVSGGHVGNAFQFPSGSGNRAKYTISGGATSLTVGVWVNLTPAGTNWALLSFRGDSQASNDCDLILSATGVLTAGSPGSPLCASSAGAVPATTWTLIEMSCLFGSGTSGSVTVKVNGSTVCSNGACNTRGGGTGANFDGMWIQSTGSISTWLVDDIYIRNDLTFGVGTDGTATPSAVALSAVVPAPTASGNSNTTPTATTRTAVVPAPTASGDANTAPAVIARSVVTPTLSFAPVITHVVFGNPPPGCSSCTIDFPVTNGPITWSISAGALPTGFVLSDGFDPETGAICGTVDDADVGSTFSFTIRATNSFGFDEWATSLTIGSWQTPDIDPTPATSPVLVGDFYFFEVGDIGAGSGIQCPTWSIVSGSLPPGLVLETGFPFGDIDGTPTTSGTYNFTVREENILGFDEQAFTIVVLDAGVASPDEVVLTVTTPAGTETGNANTSPSAIARTVVVPAPTATGGSSGGTATPSAIARTVVVPAPTATGGGAGDGFAIPSAITRTVVVPAPTATGQISALPAAIALHVTVPTPSASGSRVFPAAVALHATVPTPFVTGTFPIGTYIPVGRVRLYDRTGTTLVASLESAFDIEWQDVDNGAGIGKFKLALSDPDSLLITLGQVVYCDLYDRSNVFSFIVEKYPQMRIQSQEELGQVMEISGRGTAAILDTALCYPYDGVDAVPVRSVRSFSFASQDYLETADWVPAQAIAQQGDMTTYWVMTLPETTHLTSAPGAWPTLPIIPYWIWSQWDNSVIGKSYFRETFSTADPANVEIIATGDNYWTLYLDGVPILGDNEFQEAWQEHRSVSMLLPAGPHTVAAVVNNVFVAGLVGNPGGFLMAILIPHEGEGVDPDLMLLSDTGWDALAYPAAEPGFTPGGIVKSLLHEAQERHLLESVSCSFTDVYDSAGVAWETIPEFGVNIGASLLSTLEQLTNDGWVEWSMTASGWVLEMWAPGGRGAATAVTFTDAGNIGEATYEAAHTIVNRLLVSYGKGLFVCEPAEALASQAVWGIHEGFLTLDTNDASEASRLALKSIVTSMDDELAVTMRIEPNGASPDRPYVNFVVGDTVTGPGELGVARSYEVLGITITLDLMGDPEISLEMNRRVRDPNEVRVNLLQTLGSAVTGTAPGSRSVVFENDGPYFRTRTPTTGDVKAATPPPPGEVVFTVPGAVDTTGTSPRWVTPYRFLIYQVVMAVTTPASGEGGIIIRVLGQDFTLPLGEESILIDCELHRDSAQSFTVQLVDVGGGDATGLTVTLRYRYYTGQL